MSAKLVAHISHVPGPTYRCGRPSCTTVLISISGTRHARSGARFCASAGAFQRRVSSRQRKPLSGYSRSDPHGVRASHFRSQIAIQRTHRRSKGFSPPRQSAIAWKLSGTCPGRESKTATSKPQLPWCRRAGASRSGARHWRRMPVAQLSSRQVRAD